jgi:hypothetical protein
LNRQSFPSEAILTSDAGRDERKTVLKTIRISESLARSLEEEAAEEGKTVNAGINSLINRHFEWEKKAHAYGILELPKSMVLKLLEGCSDETLAQIGRWTVTEWKEMAEFWFQDSSPKALLNILGARSKFSPMDLTEVTEEEGVYTIVLHHKVGPRWSIVAKNALEEFVKESFHVSPRVTQGDSVVTVRFKVNPRNLSS